MKRKVKWLSALMVMVLCCQIVLLAGPLQVSGDEMAALTEDVSKRTAQTKTYQLSDGGYAAVMYAEPVHYQNENGEWETIDNSLKSVALKANAEETTIATNATMLDKVGAVVGLVETKAYLQNVNNSFKVSLPQEMSKENPVFVESGDYAISFTLLDDVNVTAENLTATSEQQELAKYQQNMATATAEEQAQLSMNETMRVPHQTAELKYAGVRPAVDVSYEVTGQSLKESIIFNEMPRQVATFTYRLDYEDLTPALQENGAVHFYAVDAAEGDEPVFIIQSPYMFDELDDISTNIAVTLTPTATGCLYTMAPDMAWLQDSARVYPVTLDPSVYTVQDASVIDDSYVYEYDPTSNFAAVNRMYVGSKYVDGTGYEFRTYVRFTSLPYVPPEACIRYAAIDLFHYYKASYQSAVDNTYDVYDAGSNNWSEATITWNSQAGYTFGDLITSYVSNMDDSDGEERAIITTMVREWYQNPSNNGLVIMPRTIDDTKTNRTCYASGDSSSTYASSRPQLVVNYYEGEPAEGIDANAVYYIRNVSTGMYLRAGLNASDQLTQNYYRPTISESNLNRIRWQVVYLGGGCYNFVPLSNTGFRMGVTSSDNVERNSVEVYTPTHSRGQTFRIYKNEDSLNSYRIQPLCSSTRVVSLAEPNVRSGLTEIELRTWSTSLHEGRWIFTKVPATEQAVCLGGEFYDPNAEDEEGEWYYNDVFAAARNLNQFGYEAVVDNSRIFNQYKNAITPEAKIVVISSHGTPNRLVFKSGQEGVFSFTSYVGDEDEISIWDIDWSNVELVVLLACLTNSSPGWGNTKGRNICQVLTDPVVELENDSDMDETARIDAMLEAGGGCGVDCVIGWGDYITYEWDENNNGEYDDVEWIEGFMQKLYEGKTAQCAVDELNRSMQFDNWNTANVVGNKSYKLREVEE